MLKTIVTAAALMVGLATPAFATDEDKPTACPVTWKELRDALKTAADDDHSGLNNHYWAVVVNREGVVCAVAYSGKNQGSQWLLSRQIAAAKAFTANGLSLDGAPFTTGGLYPTVQPGAPAIPLFGLAGGNPLDPAAYDGDYKDFGTKDDPMVGKRLGGTITFGGGLGLYHKSTGTKAIGGLGLSGDTACADHSTAWRVRDELGMKPAADDTLTLNDATAHPDCVGNTDYVGIN